MARSDTEETIAGAAGMAAFIGVLVVVVVILMIVVLCEAVRIYRQLAFRGDVVAKMLWGGLGVLLLMVVVSLVLNTLWPASLAFLAWTIFIEVIGRSFGVEAGQPEFEGDDLGDVLGPWKLNPSSSWTEAAIG